MEVDLEAERDVMKQLGKEELFPEMQQLKMALEDHDNYSVSMLIFTMM